MSKREAKLAADVERSTIAGYLEAWAATLRRHQVEAEGTRDENGKAPLFSYVGFAEAQEVDVDTAIATLEAAAEQVRAGAHWRQPQ